MRLVIRKDSTKAVNVPRIIRIFLLWTGFLAIFVPQATAQRSYSKATLRNGEAAVSEEKLRQGIEFLCDTLCQGRGTGTRGGSEAAFWIARKMERSGLVPFGGRWGHGFRVSGKAGHNIIGFFPGEDRGANTQYIIVGAHYDNLGILGGTCYPGADSNASGVVAMLSLADMLERMKELGRTFGRSVIFVAFDAKEKNTGGSQRLCTMLNLGMLRNPVTGMPIFMKDIYAMVDLDILGSSLSPLASGRKDYIIMLSNRQFTSQLASANQNPRIGLELSYDYYGSKSFTDIFYGKIGDRKHFIDNKVRTVLFTSGITMETNKLTDSSETLDYPVLHRRVLLIYYWLCSIL